VRETIAHKVERFTLAGGGRVLILDDGGCINITAGEGNPIEIMDLSFGVQLQAAALLLERGRELEHGVHRLPDDADALVAKRALATVGLAVDEASEVQRESLSTWMPPRFSDSAQA
jgi:adenosylhomocysteinase